MLKSVNVKKKSDMVHRCSITAHTFSPQISGAILKCINMLYLHLLKQLIEKKKSRKNTSCEDMLKMVVIKKKLSDNIHAKMTVFASL